MKKLAIFLSFALIVTMLYKGSEYHYHKALDQRPAPASTWHVYEKNEGEIERREPTEQEIARLALTQTARAPAAKDESGQDQDEPDRANTHEEPISPTARFQDRAILGSEEQNLYLRDDLVELNEYNPDWESLFVEDVMRFQHPNSKLLIKHEDQVVLVNRQQLRYAEQVIVSTLRANGEVTSFKALVDSGSGQLLETWNRTIVKNFRSKPLTFRPEEI